MRWHPPALLAAVPARSAPRHFRSPSVGCDGWRAFRASQPLPALVCAYVCVPGSFQLANMRFYSTPVLFVAVFACDCAALSLQSCGPPASLHPVDCHARGIRIRTVLNALGWQLTGWLCVALVYGPHWPSPRPPPGRTAQKHGEFGCYAPRHEE